MGKMQNSPDSIDSSSRAKSAADFLPPKLTLPAMKKAAAGCKGCDLYKRATQTVFSEGPEKTSVVLVGEQPGDQEDKMGRPFVGPAGGILRKALEEAGIPITSVYVTNAVKHFKWEPQGNRRKHKKPLASEIAACRPWLTAELKVTQPKIVVSLGLTAAQSLLGRPIRLGEERGKFLMSGLGREVFITIHPSAVLRHPEREQQKLEYARFVSDLALVQARLSEAERNPPF
jgi:uracil-DNA glycosylase family protein